GAALTGPGRSPGLEPAQEPVLPAAAVKASWEKAGAVFGWVSVDPHGYLVWQPGEEQPRAGALPGFRFDVFPAGGLKGLTPPEVAFGLWLEASRVTDADLKALAGLKELQALSLWYTQVTDAGVKELAGLERLRWLNLGSTRVTDAGLKGLAGLKEL